jgi:hypothetical protein
LLSDDQASLKQPKNSQEQLLYMYLTSVHHWKTVGWRIKHDHRPWQKDKSDHIHSGFKPLVFHCLAIVRMLSNAVIPNKGRYQSCPYFFELFSNKPPILKIQNKIDQIGKHLSEHYTCHGKSSHESLRPAHRSNSDTKTFNLKQHQQRIVGWLISSIIQSHTISELVCPHFSTQRSPH